SFSPLSVILVPLSITSTTGVPVRLASTVTRPPSFSIALTALASSCVLTTTSTNRNSSTVPNTDHCFRDIMPSRLESFLVQPSWSQPGSPGFNDGAAIEGQTLAPLAACCDGSFTQTLR